MFRSESMRHLLGPLLMVGACVGFAFIDMLAKYLGQALPIAEVLCLRYFFQVLTVSAVSVRGLGWRIFRTANLRLQIVRGVFLLGASICVINGLRFLPLAELTAIHFLSPIFITLLAVAFLKERTRRIDWVALCVGFIGVLVIVRPGSALLSWAVLFPVASAFCNASYQVVTRYFHASEHPATSNLYAALVGMVATLPFVPAVWRMPDWRNGLLVALAGSVAAGAHLLVTRALRHAPAGKLGTYSYTQLAWAAVFGFLVFGYIPDGLTLLGILLIAASGLMTPLYSAWKERASRA